MSNKNDYNYGNLNNSPYNSLLQRENDLTFQFGKQTTIGGIPIGGPSAVTGSGSDDGTTQTKGGSVATVTLKSEGNATDVWIQNFIRSVNWKPKSVGFYINGRTGYAEFANVYVSGTIIVAAGSIGGFDIGSNYIRDHLNSMGMSSQTQPGDNVRFWAGETFENRINAPFRVYDTGAIFARLGFIGGFELGTNYIRDAADTMGMSSVAGATEIRFWAGETFENRALSPFYVSADGTVNASKITIGGAESSVDTLVLQGIIAQANLALANQRWGQSCAFTPVDYDTVIWGAGDFVTSGNISDSISPGSTGNISGKVYVYYDSEVTGVYAVSSDINDTIGPTKVVIGIVTPGTAPVPPFSPGKRASFQLFGGGGGIVLSGSDLTPGSVGYTELTYPPLDGSGAPITTPHALGQIYIDNSNKDAYISTDTHTHHDWRKITIAPYVTSFNLSVHEDVNVDEVPFEDDVNPLLVT